ncbi:MAG: MGDG synthase family glycosyltransferase [Bacillota bacterium]|jgi:processive 1,2-diacylglycerol beta-glucosyltransferase
MKKSILIFSVSIGAGHDSAAKALEIKFRDKIPGVKIKIIDTFEYINSTLHKVVVGSYMETLKFTPKVWGYLYNQAEYGDRIIDLGQILNKLLSYKLHQLIEEFKPDAIICTHAFPAGMMSVLKAHTGLSIPIIVVLTDYTVHSFWIHDHIDYYMISSNELEHECISKGMTPDSIRPFGIPIRKEFITNYDKKLIKEELGLDERQVVLVMGGGLGLGAVLETVKNLLNSSHDLQILAVAGKNVRLYNQLMKVGKQHSNLHVFGYIENIVEHMSVADLIITKPGGLTTAEVLAKKLPMVIVDPLPGQEYRNTEFLLNWGVAVKASGPRAVSSLINQLFKNSLRMKHMREMADYLSKPHAADNITDFVINLINFL